MSANQETSEEKTPREALMELRKRFQGQSVNVGYNPHQGARERGRRMRKLRRIRKDEDI